MDSSIVIASNFEIRSVPELLEHICLFVQDEIKEESLPPLPLVSVWMENGNRFVGTPLKITGKDLEKKLLLITSDPVERPINTVWVPFSKIQSVQVEQAETISHILIAKKAEAPVSGKLLSLVAIRADIEYKWKILANKNSLLPYIYFNWDEIGKSEFEKQNIIIFATALLKAIDTVTMNEGKRVLFNRLKTLQVSLGAGKDIQFDKQGAFLIIQVNFARAPSLNIEKELVILLNDIFLS
ncbi:MAG: hypothetical protein H7256_03785 [Bdellovibrio sp.]|nr:hypothetical protein [Bdellovibrio sp.]